MSQLHAGCLTQLTNFSSMCLLDLTQHRAQLNCSLTLSLWIKQHCCRAPTMPGWQENTSVLCCIPFGSEILVPMGTVESNQRSPCMGLRSLARLISIAFSSPKPLKQALQKFWPHQRVMSNNLLMTAQGLLVQKIPDSRGLRLQQACKKG